MGEDGQGMREVEREREGESEKREREEKGRNKQRKIESQITSLIINSLHDGGRNFPLDARNTPMSCSRGAKGVVPQSKSLQTIVMFLKSEANGA